MNVYTHVYKVPSKGCGVSCVHTRIQLLALPLSL